MVLNKPNIPLIPAEDAYPSNNYKASGPITQMSHSDNMTYTNTNIPNTQSNQGAPAANISDIIDKMQQPELIDTSPGVPSGQQGIPPIPQPEQKYELLLGECEAAIQFIYTIPLAIYGIDYAFPQETIRMRGAQLHGCMTRYGVGMRYLDVVIFGASIISDIASIVLRHKRDQKVKKTEDELKDKEEELKKAEIQFRQRMAQMDTRLKTLETQKQVLEGQLYNNMRRPQDYVPPPQTNVASGVVNNVTQEPKRITEIDSTKEIVSLT